MPRDAVIGALRIALAAVALLAGCMPASDAPPSPPPPVAQHAPANAQNPPSSSQAPADPSASTSPTARKSAANDAANDAAVDALGADEVRAAQLPPEARETLRRIHSGGPFAYDRDGTTFGNREGLLPKRPRGYYTEYTVRTPGSRDRGARRIVAGRGKSGDPATGGEYWYTADHYRSFQRVRE